MGATQRKVGSVPLRQPRRDVARIPIRGQYRVEDVRDGAVVDHQRQPLQGRHAGGLEGRQPQAQGANIGLNVCSVNLGKIGGLTQEYLE